MDETEDLKFLMIDLKSNFTDGFLSMPLSKQKKKQKNFLTVPEEKYYSPQCLYKTAEVEFEGNCAKPQTSPNH